MAYFAGDHVPEKNKWLRRVHRLSSFGIMHDELVPYIWPSDARSAQYWSWARSQEREGSLWEKDVAQDQSDYLRVITLLQGCDIIQPVGMSQRCPISSSPFAQGSRSFACAAMAAVEILQI